MRKRRSEEKREDGMEKTKVVRIIKNGKVKK